MHVQMRDLLSPMRAVIDQQTITLRLQPQFTSDRGHGANITRHQFGQWQEWNHNVSLDWDALHGDKQRGLQALVRDLNLIYRDTPALYRRDCDPSGFRWIANDPQRSTICFARFGDEGDAPVVVVCNFTPVEQQGFRLGVPAAGRWAEVMNSDAAIYGGGDRGNAGGVTSEAKEWDGLPNSIAITLPPLATLIFRLE